ncbi:hypothetical protein [Rhodococcus sp. H29-C3]|uniref:hypothetical protein n=1 Tax=Rhodococcus sp. H29-C3 TaxID=3046307 RepID=UPI0024B91341|nr:hypothetical protein [Rhodococcus sp. H29-C3]MDJ0362561.1 hypothetical protein [Rhodococcus sp. H29-C3]
MTVTDVRRSETPIIAEPARYQRVWTYARFLPCAVLYGVVGYLLASTYNLIDGDGPSRVANAGYTILSRDPHLGAIGFVWNPLPSVVEIPLLLLTPVWPEMKTLGLAGVVQSAVFMALAVVAVRRIALDREVPRVWRLSEAAFIFFVVVAVRRLLLWMTTHDVLDLAWAGFAIGGELSGALRRAQRGGSSSGGCVSGDRVALSGYRRKQGGSGDSSARRGDRGIARGGSVCGLGSRRVGLDRRGNFADHFPLRKLFAGIGGCGESGRKRCRPGGGRC